LEYLPSTPTFERFWPASLHLVGKDILTTHAVYWSTMLMGLEIPLPHTIFAHGWWTVEGEKMSKSRGNVVDPYNLVDQFGADAIRYFVLREVPFGQDGDFSQSALVGRINSDLANGLGNLLSRTVTLIQRFADGKIPGPVKSVETQMESELQNSAETLIKETLPYHLDSANLEFNRALEAIWGLVQLGNQYIDKTAPWVLAKEPTNQERLSTVLYHAAETLRILSAAVYPFMPNTAQAISDQLAIGFDFSHPFVAPQLNWGGLKPGILVSKGQALFPRIDPKASVPKGVAVSSETKSLPIPPVDSKGTPAQGKQTQDKKSPAPPEVTEQISIQDFQKVQLKVAKILSAERVPKSDKLLKLQVDIGTEQRQIVAGIGKKYSPDELIGKTIVVVANLKPAKLMGIESQGMVLAAGGREVKSLVTLFEPCSEGEQVR